MFLESFTKFVATSTGVTQVSSSWQLYSDEALLELIDESLNDTTNIYVWKSNIERVPGITYFIKYTRELSDGTIDIPVVRKLIDYSNISMNVIPSSQVTTSKLKVNTSELQDVNMNYFTLAFSNMYSKTEGLKGIFVIIKDYTNNLVLATYRVDKSKDTIKVNKLIFNPNTKDIEIVISNLTSGNIISKLDKYYFSLSNEDISISMDLSNVSYLSDEYILFNLHNGLTKDDVDKVIISELDNDNDVLTISDLKDNIFKIPKLTLSSNEKYYLKVYTYGNKPVVFLITVASETNMFNIIPTFKYEYSIIYKSNTMMKVNYKYNINTLSGRLVPLILNNKISFYKYDDVLLTLSLDGIDINYTPMDIIGNYIIKNLDENTFVLYGIGINNPELIYIGYDYINRRTNILSRIEFTDEDISYDRGISNMDINPVNGDVYRYVTLTNGTQILRKFNLNGKVTTDIMSHPDADIVKPGLVFVDNKNIVMFVNKIVYSFNPINTTIKTIGELNDQLVSKELYVVKLKNGSIGIIGSLGTSNVMNILNTDKTIDSKLLNVGNTYEFNSQIRTKDGKLLLVDTTNGNYNQFK